MPESLTTLHERFVSRVFHLIVPLHTVTEAMRLPISRRIANEARNALAHVYWAEGETETNVAH